MLEIEAKLEDAATLWLDAVEKTDAIELEVIVAEAEAETIDDIDAMTLELDAIFEEAKALWLEAALEIDASELEKVAKAADEEANDAIDGIEDMMAELEARLDEAIAL